MEVTADYTATLSDFRYSQQSVKPTIALTAFVQYHLATLAKHFSGEGVDLSVWLNVCKKPTLEVNAMNADGTVAFTIPPLLTPTRLKQNKDVRYTALEVLTRANDLYRVAPGKGDKFLNDALPLFSPTPDNVNNFRQRWAAIFIGYGYDVSLAMSEEATQARADEAVYEFEDL